MENRLDLIYLGKKLGTYDGWDGCGDEGDIQFYNVELIGGNKYSAIAFFLVEGKVTFYEGEEEVREASTLFFMQEGCFPDANTNV